MLLKYYQSHFKAPRKQKLSILEMDVGDYEEPKAGGSLLRLWKAYFTNNNIYGIDIYAKLTMKNVLKHIKEVRVIKVFKKQLKKHLAIYLKIYSKLNIYFQLF